MSVTLHTTEMWACEVCNGQLSKKTNHSQYPFNRYFLALIDEFGTLFGKNQCINNTGNHQYARSVIPKLWVQDPPVDHDPIVDSL